MMEELGLSSSYQVAESMPTSRKVRRFVSTGKVPVLLEYDDDRNSTSDETPPSFILYESSAINTYLADRFPQHSLVPPRSNLQQRALYDQIVSCITTELDSQGLWIHRKHEAMAQYFGAIPEAVAHARDQFDRINTHLAASLLLQHEDHHRQEQPRYLLGNEFTAADILYVHCLDWAKGIGWHTNWPKGLDDYRKRCQARPAYQRAKTMRDTNVDERRSQQKGGSSSSSRTVPPVSKL